MEPSQNRRERARSLISRLINNKTIDGWMRGCVDGLGLSNGQAALYIYAHQREITLAISSQ